MNLSEIITTHEVPDAYRECLNQFNQNHKDFADEFRHNMNLAIEHNMEVFLNDNYYLVKEYSKSMCPKVEQMYMNIIKTMYDLIPN